MQTQNKSNAQNLRKALTHTEKILWKKIRNRKVSNAKFRRQQPFGRYILDFYCPEHKLCIEIDGSQHAFPDHKTHDQKREDFLRTEGIRTIRFWNSEIRDKIEIVLDRIKKEIETPSP